MKILHVINSLQMGGAEKLMVDLLPRLNQKGIECDLLTFDGTPTPFRQQLDKSGVKVIDFNIGCKPYSLSNIVKLIPIIRKYEIVHTHNTAPQLFTAIASMLCSVVLVTTEHTTSNRRRDWKWYAPIDRWMYSRYKKVICCSEKAEINLTKWIHSSKKLCIVNNGVDISRFSNAFASSEFRAQFPNNSRLITMVAGFRWEKDQDTIIRSLNHLDERFHLVLVGDGVRRSELESLVEKNHLEHRVHFLGIRSDVPEILKSSDYIVMSSHFEGLSLSSVEGMSVGKPMLASNVDGLKQVIEGAGVLFKEGDDHEFAKWIKELENGPILYAQTAQKCFDRAQKYDISVMVNGYIKVYNELSK